MGGMDVVSYILAANPEQAVDQFRKACPNIIGIQVQELPPEKWPRPAKGK